MNKKEDNYLNELLQSVVVEASAGSGKTYILARRYVQLLLYAFVNREQHCLRSILAITFTNKAAFEMKSRILELLKSLALCLPSDDDKRINLSLALNSNPDILKKHARCIVDEIIRNYNFFQVKTIDSFINALLAGSVLSIKRSANFHIKRDYRQQLKFCLDLVIDKAAEDADVFNFFQEFLKHYLFVENRTGWFPKEDILGFLSLLFMLSNIYGESFGVYDGNGGEVIATKKDIYMQINKIAEQLPEGINANARKSIILFLNNNGPIFDIANLPSVFKKTIIPINKNKYYSPSFAKLWKSVSQQLVQLVELESVVVCNPYINVFREVTKFFQHVSQDYNLLFLEELNKQARFIFSSEDITVADIYYRLAGRFRHYLIDEFQDTSILQWRNLEVIVEDALSCGGTLFCVGDRKQAIYRFRGGDARLFDTVRKQFSHFSLESKSLTKNWRSQKEIVKFNNCVFSQENLVNAFRSWEIPGELAGSLDFEKDIIKTFEGAVQEYKEENCYGYVEVERLEEKNQTERNSMAKGKVLNLVKDLSKRFCLQDIAILARDNNEVELFTSWCLSEGYSVDSEKTLNVLENYLIKGIISFLESLYSPLNDLHFALFLLSDFFIQASEISFERISDFIFDCNEKRKRTKDTPLYRLFQESFPWHWKQYINEFSNIVGVVPPYELVVSIYRQFAVSKKFKDNQVFFMKFLELIKTKEDEFIGLGDLLLYFKNASGEELYVDSGRSDSIKILTVHKSKGLEFPVVIIPFLRLDVNAAIGGKGSNFYLFEMSNKKLGLLKITKKYLAYSKKLRNIYARYYKLACIDELNSMYVALTRSQLELYIFIPKKSASSKNKACFIIPEGTPSKGRKRCYPEGKKIIQPFKEIVPLRTQDWVLLIKEEFKKAEQKIQSQQVIDGLILHGLFSRIGNCVGEDIDVIINSAFDYVKPYFLFPQPIEFYKNKVRETLENKRFADIFYVFDGDVYCEQEVVNRYGDLKRIDRVVVRNKQIVGIEYKTSYEKKEQHTKQITEYQNILKELYPAREVKACIIYLDTMQLEAVA